MYLHEARRILGTMGTPEFKGTTEDILAARKLGEQALNIIHAIRHQIPVRICDPMDGETLE